MSKQSNLGSSKGAKTKDLKGPGTLPLQSAMVGGVGNGSSKSAKKSGKVDAFCDGGVAGGFRNNGMANKR